MSDNNVRTLKTVEITCEILGLVRESGEVGVTELSNQLDLSKGAIYNHLATLHEQGLLIKMDGRYRLSYSFLNFGKAVQNRSMLYLVGKEYIDQLAERTGEYAHLMVEEDGRGYYIYRSRGENAIAAQFHERKNEKPDYLHHSSTGKAILAEMSRREVREIIDRHGLPKSTENTITTEEELFNELEQTRERGYAVYDGEELSGTRAVGVAINTNSSTHAALSVSGPVARMQDESWNEEIPREVQQTANLIEVDLQTKTNQISERGVW
jgi:DNA-binding IclR family transcriptional regulator